MSFFKISDLPAATSAGATDQLETNQGGTSRRLTVSQIAAHVSGNLTDATVTGTAVVSANSANTALRITQTGSGNALVVEDSANPDATPFIIDQAGAVGIGGTPTVRLETFGESNNWVRINTAAGVALFSGYRSNGTIASKTIVSSGDQIARFDARGYDGANFIQAAQINAEVDGTPGTNDMPGRLVFLTTADGASSPTERMRINNAGNVGIGSTPVSGTRLVVAGPTNNPQATATDGAINQYMGYCGFGSAFSGTSTNHPYVFLVNNSERMRIDASGNVGIGTSSPGATLDVSGTSFVRNTRFGGPAAYVQRRANGTAASPTIVANNENQLIRFDFFDGTAYIPGAQIVVEVDGTPGTNDMPGRLVFSTTADGAAGPTERMRITNAGNVGIGTSAPVNRLQVNGSFGRGAPVTKTGNFTLADTENWLICNGTGSITVTFPAASSWTGREVMIKTIAAQTVVSASSNVVPINSATAGTAILPATAGAWSTLVSDGTNWIIMARGT